MVSAKLRSPALLSVLAVLLALPAALAVAGAGCAAGPAACPPPPPAPVCANATAGPQAGEPPPVAASASAGPAPAPSGSAATVASAAAGTTAGAAGAAPPEPAPPATAEPTAPDAVPAIKVAFKNVFRLPVKDIALGRRGVIAVLSDEPWIDHGQHHWRELKLPGLHRAQKGERERLRIFIGRDNLPRVMGAIISRKGQTGVYLRHKDGRWQRSLREIGRLDGEPPGGLFGILGFDDPELVCKAGDQCLIKSRKGWQNITAPSQLGVASRAADNAWIATPTLFARAGGKSLLERGGQVPWHGRRPAATWTDGRVHWVCVAGEDTLYRLDDQGWTEHSSPIAGPRALWGSSGKAVWVAGAAGAGYYDGTRWLQVKGAPEHLRAVTGQDRDVWLGGSSGLWQGRSPAEPAPAATQPPAAKKPPPKKPPPKKPPAKKSPAKPAAKKPPAKKPPAKKK